MNRIILGMIIGGALNIVEHGAFQKARPMHATCQEMDLGKPISLVSSAYSKLVLTAFDKYASA